MGDRPILRSVPSSEPEEIRDVSWKNNLQRHGDVDAYLRHARREFGPVPDGGAAILRIADYRQKRRSR